MVFLKKKDKSKVIINIVPITDLPLLLGLDLPTQQENPAQLTYQQLSLAVTPAGERLYTREPEEAGLYL